jgi:hypothetical protein
MDRTHRYTCNEYRQEMILISLRRRLQQDDLSENEKDDLRHKIHQLEMDMDMI